ncbi:MAG: tRNA glutamyl-Q(34) synthetase GluQRS [Bacteroidaceae bacterium]|nr:tRNA glutamyl-Q(34) synthetase GluQRS [Bacteroidaceae bacterium]
MTRGRFAPSPTGRMHLGNVFCALLSWLSAKSKGGEWVLRIEDLDPQRSKREYALQLMDDLQWLGLPWDGEPVWQSERGEIYEEHLHQLAEIGLTYPCFCTRADIMATQAPHETDGRVVYKGTCRPNSTHPSTLTPHPSPLDAATRLMVPNSIIPFTDGHYGKHDINLAEHCGDYILRRKDGAWAYQLAVVIDDALMGITEIVRGRDLLLSSPQQIHLRELLFQRDIKTEKGKKEKESGKREMENFAYSSSLTIARSVSFYHHPLLCNKEGLRLCKRDKSMDLGYLRAKDITSSEIIGRLAHLAGLIEDYQPMHPQDLLEVFSWNKIPTTDIIIKYDVQAT